MADRLFYFSRSANRLPGQGANEYVSDPNRYLDLARTPNWRQILSNFWVAPFEVNGVRWNSVEHMFQGYKINLADPQRAWLFTLNSGSDLGRSEGSVAQRNRKMIVLTPQQLAQWEQLKDSIMYTALKAKFSQNELPKQILLQTRDAELWHSPGRTRPERQFLLERVRNELRGQAISFDQLGQLFARGRVAKYELIPMTFNHLVILTDTDGQVFSSLVQYNAQTNQILPPV